MLTMLALPSAVMAGGRLQSGCRRADVRCLRRVKCLAYRMSSRWSQSWWWNRCSIIISLWSPAW